MTSDASSSIVRLNIGGEKFCTTVGTLTQREPHSMLAAMFSGRHTFCKDSEGLVDRITKVLNKEMDAELTRIDIIKSVQSGKVKLRGVNLSGLDLSYLDLSRADLSYTRMKNVSLSGAYLYEANLGNANLEGANLAKACLTRAHLDSANLERANLEGANLEGAELSYANFKGANLQHASLPFMNIHDPVSTISGEKFCTTVDTLTQREPHSMLAAMFGGRHTVCKDSEGYVFIDRDGKHFRHVLNWLRNGEVPDLTKSKCSELLLEAEYYQLLGLSERITQVLNKEMDPDLTRTDIIKCVQSEKVKLRGVNLSGLDLSYLDLTGADLSSTCMKNVLFFGANLQNANLRNANLEGANLTKARLKGAYIEGANLKLISFVNFVTGTGGKKFCTTVDTLTQREPHSMLAAMFGGHHTVCKDSEGYVFVDRDGKHFRHILNWLRNGVFPNLTDSECQELLLEAEYYQLLDLSNVSFSSARLKDVSFSHANLNGSSFWYVVAENTSFQNAKMQGDLSKNKAMTFIPDSLNIPVRLNFDASNEDPEVDCVHLVDSFQGGKKFSTTVDTLTHREPHSMLAVMFSGRHTVCKDSEGYVFIDRDGKHFRHVLNWLREGIVPDLTESECSELLREAKYYQLLGLVDEITEVLNRKKDVKEMHTDLTRTDIIKWVRSSGKKFSTTVDTLTQREPHSMLAAMFGGRHTVCKDSEGYVFIDRDGKHFRHVLNWLRNGVLPNLTDSESSELLLEAEYFQLLGLVDGITEVLNRKKAGKEKDTRLKRNDIIKRLKNEQTRLSGVNLSDLDLSNVDLNYVDFSYMRLKNISFSNANLEGAKFRNVDAENTDFRKATLRNCEFTGANLRGALLDGANLQNAWLMDCSFRGADLRYAQLQSANLTNANLEGANLERACIDHAKVNNANFKGANLKLYYVRGVNFHSTFYHAMNSDAPSSSIVRLNIGGEKFCTTVDTLTHREPHSMLAAMFSGRHTICKDSEGCVFVDRDGKHFRHVLNWLRDGAVPDLTKSEFSELLREAEYYQLLGFVERITEVLNRKKDGGENFCTTVDTLTQREPHSMLAAMFGGRHTLSKDSEGYVFVDRDGKHFRHVLNWLREGVVPDLTESEFSELLREAKYYQLLGLLDMITEVLNRKKDGKEMDTDLTRTDIIKCVRSKKVKLRGVNLCGLDLSNLDLSNVDFSYTRLKNVSFSGANLERAKFMGAILNNANLKGANLQHATVPYMKLPDPVSGKKFSTGVDTLTQRDPHSMLAVMFSGRHTVFKDSEGYVFIDRDGKHFRHVLNWLRDGVVPDLTESECSELFREAKYYQLLDLSYVDFSYTRMKNIFFSSANLEGAKFQNVDAKNTDFHKATLRKCEFTGANLRGALLDGANLHNACLIDCSFRGADLRSAHLHSANLTNANLEGANLEGANMNIDTVDDFIYSILLPKQTGGKKFSTTVDTLTHREPHSMLAVMFSGRHTLCKDSEGYVFIDRDGKHFRHVLNWLRDGIVPDLTKSECSQLLREAEYYQLLGLVERIAELLNRKKDGKEMDTDLTRTDIIKCLQPKYSVKLRGVNLSGLDLSNLDLSDVDFSYARLDNVSFSRAILKRAKFHEVNLEGANLQRANLEGAILERANLAGAHLEGAKLNNANLKGANLHRAYLRDACLEGAKVERADLLGAIR
ncbi:hypothetical protein SSX86_023592 [Deinandra increscens subsp. villosa]|uniref:BTB domain-containing protein n=1 Tax=Deinandra increscens subsp. villosa TaxID=3103831 RepID=A0AAP0CL55_9ASTR